MLSFKAGFGKGIPTAIVLGILGGIVWLGLSQFFKMASIFELFLEKFGILWWIAKPTSYLIIVVAIWALGHIKLSSVVKWFFGRFLKKKTEERKWLFGVRIKNFLGGYPIGLVSRVYLNHENRIVYNIVYLNLGGIWTFRGIPADETERVVDSAEEIIQTTFSAGFL